MKYFHLYAMQAQVLPPETFSRNIPNQLTVYNEFSINKCFFVQQKLQEFLTAAISAKN